MPGMFEFGCDGLVKTCGAEAAKRCLAPVFGNVLLHPREDEPFEMEFGLAAYEAAAFFQWRFGTEMDVVASFEQHLICVVLRGRVEIEEGGKAVLLEGPIGVVLPPSPNRHFRWHADAALVGIVLGERNFRRGALAMQPGISSVRLGSYRQFGLSIDPGTAFTELLEILLADRRSGQPSKDNKSIRLLLDRLIVYSLLRLLANGREREGGGTLVPRHVKQAEEYIRSHLADPLDSEVLANVVDVSSRSLHRAFLQFRGITPARYIQDLRLEMAHKLLTVGKDEIRDIAFSAGFKSYPAFWRSYVRKFGVSPSKSRGTRE